MDETRSPGPHLPAHHVLVTDLARLGRRTWRFHSAERLDASLRGRRRLHRRGVLQGRRRVNTEGMPREHVEDDEPETTVFSNLLKILLRRVVSLAYGGFSHAVQQKGSSMRHVTGTVSQ